MGPAMLGVLVAVTSATAAEDLFDALPLSADDLALIEALADTASAADPVDAPLVFIEGADVVAERWIDAGLGRTVAENLDARPTLLVMRRRSVARDTLVLRGRGGHRVDVRVDGVRLHDAASNVIDDARTWLVDPWSVERAIVGTRSVELFGATPRDGPHSRARIIGRGADRSSGAYAAGEVGDGEAGFRVGAGYADQRALSLGGRTDAPDSAHQRIHAAGRAHVLGERVRLGLDFDRVLNPPGDAVDAVQRRMIFGHVLLGDDRLLADVLVAHQSFDNPAGPRSASQSLQLAASARMRFNADFAARVGAEASLSTADLGRSFGRSDRVDAFFGADLATDFLEGHADLRVAHGRSEFGTLDTSATQLAGDALVRLTVFDPFFFHVGFDRGLVLPSADDLRRANAGIQPEVFTTVEAGPALEVSGADVAIVGFVTFVDDALTPVADVLANRDERLAGLEARGRWQVVRGLFLEGACAWTDGQLGVTRLHARYELDVRNAFVEMSTRLTRDAARVRLLGGTDIGAGFRVDLAVDNALDSDDGLASGLDVRAALTHRW